jgi:hypothetical protein
MIQLMIGLALAAAPASVPSEQAAALAAAEAMLATLRTKDNARMLALTVPEGGATAVVEEAGKPPRLHHFTWPEFVAHLPKDQLVEERLLDHLVRVDGDVAMVWGRFQVHVDGKLFSCGTDHFDLVRTDGSWRVLNITWNQRREGCGR